MDSTQQTTPDQRYWKRHPYLSCLLASLAIGIVVTLPLIAGRSWMSPYAPLALGIYPLAIGLIFGLPVVLIVIHAAELVSGARTPHDRRVSNVFDVVTFVAILTHSFLYLLVTPIIPSADWDVQLINSQLHTPIATDTWPTMFAIGCIALAAYFALTYAPLEKAGPLAATACIAGVYLGIALALVWCIQLSASFDSAPLELVGIALVLIGAKAVRNAVIRYRGLVPYAAAAPALAPDGPYRHRPAWLARCETLLGRTERWPAVAVALMWPILGIAICILMLFGQEPNAVIAGWLNTSDWTLSTQTAPPNLYVDEHYLCTAAANGHRKVVKPLRRGVRHGHEVVVNRQLCVANAFEDLLKERAPWAHTRIRGFYDAYGLPIARLIRTKAAADITYLGMKPLEWVFLATLYLFDPKPEDRIAVQYAPRRHA